MNLKSNRVLFLDVDGVLNCSSTKERLPNSNIYFVEDSKILLLKQLIDLSGTKVVLSSTWRLDWNDDPKDIYNIFIPLRDKLLSFDIELYDKTPQSLSGYRGEEISLWLNHHSEVSSFVILDDETDMKPFRNRLVQTTFYNKGSGAGLLPKHIPLALKILEKPYRKEAIIND